MKDLLSGLTGGGWAFLVGWIFPSGITVAFTALLIFPPLADIPVAEDIANLSATQISLILAFTAVALGVILSAIQRFLYRVLEGYYLPKSVQKKRIQKYREMKQELRDRAQKAAGLDQAMLLEQWQTFPQDDDQIAPTSFANGLRTLETYGQSRFQLDSQVLWSELTAVVPEALRTEHDRARATVDFFVSSIYLSAAFGLAALLTTWWTNDGSIVLAAAGLAGLVLTIIWYRFAVASTHYWRSTVQALVNVGRKELAAVLGLQLPNTLEQERDMWELVTWLVYYGYDAKEAKSLDSYRIKAQDNHERRQPNASS